MTGPGAHEAAPGGLVAWLYDAGGADREVAPERDLVEKLKGDQLLWVDLDGRDRDRVEGLGRVFRLDADTVGDLADRRDRAALFRHEHYLHLVLLAVEPARPGESDIDRRPIDLLAGRNWVVTVHEGRIRAFEAFLEQVRGETRIGELDAASFMGALVDSQLSSYFGVIEVIEQEIDQIDERALRSDGAGRLLDDLVRLRRRTAFLRRTLAPHREAFAPLARPDFELHDEVGDAWPDLVARLERTLDAVENVRDLLVGSFDIHMGQLAQRTNEVMKVLTIVSSLLLPSVVLAGVMGMNFKMSFFEDSTNFWIVIGGMAALAAAILGVARWRRWI